MNRDTEENNRDLMSFIKKPDNNSQSDNSSNDASINDSQSDISSKKTSTVSSQMLEEKGKDLILLAPDNLSASYLIDVKYDGKVEKAYVKLYNPEDERIYRWYDNTNHLPYLLTTMKKTDVENILGNDKEFVGCEVVTKFNRLNQKDLTLTKVFATNPLAIGGRSNSYREKIRPSFETNIRYHLNYIYDNSLIPGFFFEIKNKNLVRKEPKIQDEVKRGILEIFKGQSPEILELVKQYLPLFFAPIPTLKRCSVDIEVESEKDKIPNPHAAEQKVISIGITNEKQETCVYVLNENKKTIDQSKITVDIKEFDNEAELLIEVFKEISKFPIVITFNGDNFDFLYLDNRAKNLKIQESLNPFVRTRTQDVYLVNGIHLDLYRFFRQPAIRIYAFGGAYERNTLDELGRTLLNKEKLKHEKDIWDLDLEELIEYNGRDAEITFELTSFNNNQVIELIIMLSRITKMPMDDFTRAPISIWIQNWMYYEHRVRNNLIPRQEDILQLKGDTSTEAIIKGKKYQGAIVIEPQAGVWWNVYTLDFASLYPSIIKTRNLSYESINCIHPECKKNKIHETNHWICEKQVGISSMLVGFIRDIRVYWFKERAKDSTLSEKERKESDVIQSSLKVLLNACLPYDEEIIIRNKQNEINKIKIGELESQNWKNLEVLSIGNKKENLGKQVFVPILNFMDNGEQELIEIKIKDGRSLRCTRNHIIPRMDGETVLEVAAEDLKIGEDILICNKIKLPNNKSKHLFLPDELHTDFLIGLSRDEYKKYSYRRNQRTENQVISLVNEKFSYSKQSRMYSCSWIKLQKDEQRLLKENSLNFMFYVKHHRITGKWYSAVVELSEDFFKLLGYFISKGSIAKNRFHISQKRMKNEEKYRKIESVMERLSNKKHFQLYKTEHSFSGNGNIMTELLRALCGKGSRNKRIPVHLLDEKRSRILLDAFFLGDGNYNARGRKRYSTISIQLKNDIVYLLNGLGIETSIHRGKSGIFRVVESYGKNYRRKGRGKIELNNTTIGKIISIEPSTKERVYDITTGNGWFVTTNGLVVHNCYGVFGSDNFALYCPPVAESTAALAREAISKTKQYTEEKLGLKVLYGDTDSIFVHKPTLENIKELEKWSMDTFQIELGIDYIFRYCCLSDRKKNYFGITTRGVPIVKGLMGKKKNTPELAKKPFEKSLEILTEVQNAEDLEIAKTKIIKTIQQVNQKISKKEFELEELAINVTMSKKIEQYDSWTQPLQAAVQLIINFPDGEKPTVGSFINFIKTRPFQLPPHSIKLSDKIVNSNECSVKPIQLAKKTDVDIAKVKELLKSTLIQLLDTIGISWSESIEGQKSLDNWFK